MDERVATGDVVEWLASLHRTHATLAPIAWRILDVIASDYVGGRPPTGMTIAQWADRVQCMQRSAFRSLLELEQRGLIKRLDPERRDALAPVRFELNPQPKPKD